MVDAKLAAPHSGRAISDPSGLRERSLRSRLWIVAGGETRDSASVQEPTQAEVFGVLHTGRVQLCDRDQRPFCRIPCHTQEFIDLVPRTQAKCAIIMDEQSALNWILTVAGCHDLAIVVLVFLLRGFAVSTKSEVPPPCGRRLCLLEKIYRVAVLQPILHRAHGACFFPS